MLQKHLFFHGTPDLGDTHFGELAPRCFVPNSLFRGVFKATVAVVTSLCVNTSPNKNYNATHPRVGVNKQNGGVDFVF